MGAFASHHYLKSFSDSAAHVRYIAFREREDKSESLGLFSEHEDSANAEEFIKTLDVKRFNHPDIANLHTVLFSMSGDEYNRSGFEDGDYKKIIRNVMKDWEIKTGYRLDWVAASHLSEGHPHTHVAIRAAYKDRDGIEHRLKISNEDRKFFSESFQKHKEIIRPFDPPSREHSYELERPFTLDTSLLDSLMFQIKRNLEQEEWEREQARKKSMNKERTR